MNPLYRLLEYARPYRVRLGAAVGAMAVYSVASAWLAMMVRPIFDEVLPSQQRLLPIIIAILAAYLLKGVSSYLSSYLMADVGHRAVHDLRKRLFQHMLGQSASFFSLQTTGRLMSRITNDVGQLQRTVSETVGDVARESLVLVALGFTLVYFDARLALFCFTGAPLVVYPLVQFGRRVRRTSRRSQEALSHMSHVSAEAFAGHRIVKAFGAEQREASKFEQASRHFYRTTMKVTRVLSLLPPLMEMVGGVAFVLALWYGSRKIAAGDLTTGEFVTFITVLFMMYGPARKLSRVNADLQQAVAAAERVFEVLDTRSEVRDRDGAAILSSFSREIVFRDVRFSYESADVATLNGVSFAVRAGQTLAVVGRSGAGKTTLVNLVPRFYDPTGGAILIDGVDTRDITLASLRAQIGIVTQETVLFDDTVAANIAYGRPAATRAQVESAARAAHAHEFIVALDQGYDTMIGERGQRLSGGQRQRLAIARAILRDSPILILDEATSALDAESEALVQDALSTLMLNRTSFVIAHRLSTVRRASVIVVLEEGRVVESGTHEDLLNRGGAYAKLHERQLQDEPVEVEP